MTILAPSEDDKSEEKLLPQYANSRTGVLEKKSWDDPYIQNCIGRIAVVHSQVTKSKGRVRINKWWVLFSGEADPLLCFPAKLLSVISEEQLEEVFLSEETHQQQL